MADLGRVLAGAAACDARESPGDRSENGKPGEQGHKSPSPVHRRRRLVIVGFVTPRIAFHNAEYPSATAGQGADPPAAHARIVCVMTNSYAAAVLRWYAANARDLPWRAAGASAWSVLVSEIMLQQTPVARVLPAHAAWLGRWPTPPSLAAAPAGEAVRQWGRLGYPRRALRLHATATILAREHCGQVPASVHALRSLPGVGSYTAAAVASFAFGQRHVVLDTNVRRVLARLVSGEEFPPRSPSAAEAALAESLLPADPPLAARWSVAVMELGALVCRSTRPVCSSCPVAQHCEWHRAGRPPAALRPATQRYTGTDRQCRGRLLAILRDSEAPVPATALAAAWPDPAQRTRALGTLVADGLAELRDDGRYTLPGEPSAW
jgi:A/G-specific adenine glycosylase